MTDKKDDTNWKDRVVQETLEGYENMLGVFEGTWKKVQDEGKDLPLAQMAKILIGQKNLEWQNFDVFFFEEDTYSQKLEFFRILGDVVVPIEDDWMVNLICSETMLSYSKAKELWGQMKFEMYRKKSRYGRSKKDVKPVGFADDVGYFWNRMKLKRADVRANPVRLSDIPEFAELLDLFRSDEDRRAFLLFCGSIFDYASSRHQYLHIHGAGGEGKSAFTEMLRKVIGERASQAVKAYDIEQKHFGVNLEGTRLLLFNDENNPGFIQSGAFKRMTGESSMTVEPKFKDPRTIPINFKIIITSNSQIQIGKENADIRRLVSVKLNPAKRTNGAAWYQGLQDSREKVVAYIIQEYEREILADPQLRFEIPAPAVNTEEACETNYVQWEDALHASEIRVTGRDEHRIKRAELHYRLSSCSKIRMNSPKMVADLKHYLEMNGASLVKYCGAYYYKGVWYHDPLRKVPEDLLDDEQE